MKTILLTAGIAVMTLVGLALPACAQTIPNVAGLTPFSRETRYMSLPGYLRWQYHVETAVWISRAEAVALVNQQVAIASTP